MKAIVYQEPKVAKVVDRAVPDLRDDYILIKVVAIALNPTDWKHIEYAAAAPGCICGVDYAGVVEEVGSKVTKDFKKGDRIAGWVSGGNSLNTEDGAFAEFIVAKGDLQIKVPEHFSFEEAATLGCGVGTVGQGLYEPSYGLELSPPSKPVSKPEQVLVYGGSTATGTLGIQFLKASGYEVLTTCSPKHFALVKSLGATEAFDYKEPDVGKKINEYTKNGLKYVWDCIGLESSLKISLDAISTEPGCRYGSIGRNAQDETRKDIKYTHTLLYLATGESVNKAGTHYEGSTSHFEEAKKWIEEAEPLLAAGKVKTHPISLREGGLEGALVGIAEMRDGRYSGEKLVYRIV
ncbi:hypothetical protein B7494_g4467 [Chlorociboria aeruginascens]|nr:hypothetical protein B7494_g4467 [Chlorociboria aeruginascens]